MRARAGAQMRDGWVRVQMRDGVRVQMRDGVRVRVRVGLQMRDGVA